MEKTNRTLSEIAIAGPISKATLNASSFFLRSIIPYLSEYYRVTVFTNERVPSPDNQSINGAEEILHIHQLPEYWARKKYKAILYSIENSKESFLYRWYAVQYPGIVLLQDKNLFRLESGSLRYGTDGRDLNALIRSHHGNEAIPIGDQHVRGRSLEIYAELYPCIESLLSNAVGIGVFPPIEDLPLSRLSSKPVFTLRRPLAFSHDSLFEKDMLQKQEHTLLVIVDSPFSRSAQELLSFHPGGGAALHFPLAYTIKVTAHNYEIVDHALLQFEQLLENDAYSNASCHGVLILGHRPHSSIKSQCFQGFINGALVSSEYLGEFTGLPSSFSFAHSREDSLKEIMQKMFFRNKDCKVSTDRYEEYRLHDPLEVSRTLYENVEWIYHSPPPVSLQKSESRRENLLNIYQRIHSNFDLLSDEFPLMSPFIESEKSILSSHYHDLFGVG